MKKHITTAPASDEMPESGAGIRVNFEDTKIAERGLSPEDIALLRRYWADIVNDPTKSWKDVKGEIGYGRSTMSRVFRGIYSVGYTEVLASIASHYKLRETATPGMAFIKNDIADAIFSAFIHALANREGAAIFGPSRIGKSMAVDAFVRSPEAAGRAVKVEAPPIGGAGAFHKEICRALGLHERNDQSKRLDDLRRACAPRRLIIVDEAHLLSGRAFNVIKWIHNQTNSTFAIVATDRLRQDMVTKEYQFEQISGRSMAVIRLYEAAQSSWLPIVQQVIANPTQEALTVMARLVAGRGRIGVLCGTLRMAQKLARSQNVPCDSSHFLRAAEIRKQTFDSDFYRIPPAKKQIKGGTK